MSWSDSRMKGRQLIHNEVERSLTWGKRLNDHIKKAIIKAGRLWVQEVAVDGVKGNQCR